MGRSIFLISFLFLTQLVLMKCALQVDSPIKNEIVEATVVNILSNFRNGCKSVSFKLINDSKIIDLTLCSTDLINNISFEKNKVYKLNKSTFERTKLKGTSLEHNETVTNYEFLNYLN